MKQSQLFSKTRKEVPADEVAKNARLLIRAGYIHKNMAGVYEFLPLGLRVMNKISQIVREEMNTAGGVELKMSVLQDKDSWEASKRWGEETMNVWFKSKLVTGTDVGLGNTHEEPLTNLMKEHISSYKDLPRLVYQIQVKFRNELRAKSGILRGREFLMKDLYSFSRTNEEHEEIYGKFKEVYKKVFDRLGIGDRTFFTFASGGAFSEFSHEFQTLADSGEDTIYLDRKNNIAVNKEVYSDKVLKTLSLEKADLEELKAIEVGNIFSLGTRFSDALGLTFKDEKGERQPVVMGSYGIGIGRVMGAIVESYADEDGLLWPEPVAPFKVHLLALGEDEKVKKAADKLYADLEKAGTEVLYDDRDMSAGAKLNDTDLIGIPYRVVVSNKTLEKKSVELKERGKEAIKLLKQSALVKHLK